MTVALARTLLSESLRTGVMVACAESCTGGLLAGAITDVAGSSAVFERGFVTYSNAAKQAMLGVSPMTLVEHGAVSEQVASEMALGALAHSEAQMAVSVTGIAGPGGSEFKPEGRVCFAVAFGDTAITHTMEFGAIGRARVRAAAVTYGLERLIEAMGALPDRPAITL